MRGKSAEMIEDTLNELKENGVGYSWDSMRRLTEQALKIEAESRMIPEITFLRNASLLLNSKYAEQEDMEKLFGDTKVVGEQVTDKEILDASIGKSKSELSYEFGMKMVLEFFKDSQTQNQYANEVSAKIHDMPMPKSDRESAEIIQDYVSKNIELMSDSVCRSFTGMGKEDTVRLLNEGTESFVKAIETNLNKVESGNYLSHTARRCMAIEAIAQEKSEPQKAKKIHEERC